MSFKVHGHENNEHDAGHMTKTVDMLLYGINRLKIFFQRTSGYILTKFGMKHQGLKFIIFCSNKISGLTLTCFVAWSNLATKAFKGENVTMMDSLKIIASCDLEFGLYSKLNY